MMKRDLTLLLAGSLLWSGVTTCAFAQRGMGEPAGVASQAVKPEVISLSGDVLAVETGPCEKTTGRAESGAHFLLETPEGQTLNVHLGPVTAVNHVIERLPVGKKVTVDAFRTEKMPPSHYVAQSLAFDGISIQLRDQTLHPLWARGMGSARGLNGPSYGRGLRRGLPRRNRLGYGPGRGRGWEVGGRRR